MKLKRLEIYGFKSFALRTLIEFNQGITGIVGPNGSGKSNIGDAVRWVLGEQSAKTLRGAKMEDIIFGGTQKRRSMTYCEVSLVFDNEDKSLPLDFTEIMVTRRVFRTGDSEYYINKTACRLKDVVALFRDTGIGKEGYSIIGQGRIDEILSQKGEERRKVFEEAAGIVSFKSRKEEAQTKLARTNDNLSRLADVMDALFERITPLEKQAETARQYLAFSEELKGLDLNLFVIKNDKINNRIEQMNQSMHDFDALLRRAQLQTDEMNLEKELLQSDISQIDETLSSLRLQLDDANNAYHEQKNRAARFEIELKNHEENLLRLENEKEADELRSQELIDLGMRQKGGMEQKSKRLIEKKQALSIKEADLKALSDAAAQKEAELEAHKAAYIEAMNRVSDLKAIEQRQKAVQAQMENRLTEIDKSILELKASYEKAQEDFDAQHKLYEQGKATLQSLADHAQETDDKVRDINQKAQEAQETLQRNDQTLKSSESRLRVLEEMAKGYEGYYQSVKAALTHAKKTGIKGVHDVVAMLLSVPKELETAIDMVLGATLQNIVTQDEGSAKVLIDYLRQNRLGRATFLPMTTLRGKTISAQERHVLQMDGCLGIASELVSFAPEYKEVVENLLGRTVIAKTLNEGIEIMRAGRQAFRLVTLDGDVMHSGGSMTGGSVQQKAGSFLSREREIKELRQWVLREKQMQQTLEKALATAELERKQQKQVRQEIHMQWHQQDIAVARDKERQEAARERMEGMGARLDALVEAQEQITQSIEEISLDLVRISANQGDGQSDTRAMQDKTEELRLSFQNAREAVEALRESLTSELLEFTKQEHETQSLLKDRERLQTERQAVQSRIEKTASQITALQAQIESCREAMASGDELIQKMHQETERCERAWQNTDILRIERRRQLSALHETIEKLHLKTADDADSRHQVELQRAKLDAELHALQERIFNTYELTYAGAKAYQTEEAFDYAKAEKRAAELRSSIRSLGPVNVSAMEEYADTKARFDEMASQKADLEKAQADLEELIARLEKQMERQFVSQFALVQGFFKETFVRLFGGGHAELRLENPKDALNCGIEVIAQPPGKKLQLLSLLSGGERALCAIAILFAMLKLKATPFCILDEIEAALDEANIGYFADYLVEYSEKTQFVVVTHRKGTMERCDALYGVAMEEQGVSKMVSVNLTDYDA